MRFLLRQFQGLGLGLALISVSAAGQDSPARLSAPAISNLRLLSRSSGYIFDGTVLAVERDTPNETDSVPTIQISFRVEQAIRGTRAGQVLTIREWVGLWNSGERYRPGERLLLFLYSPSKLGLTSPVGGPAGRFPVDSRGTVVLEDGHLPALAPDFGSKMQERGKNQVNVRALMRSIQRADAE